MTLPVEFFVEGRPQTAGSKTAVRGSAGRPLIVESGDRAAKRAWREDVRGAARTAIGDASGWPLEGAVEAEFVFMRRRPKGHYGSGRNAGVLKVTAAAYPVARPDLLKQARAAEDSLTGIAWHDDAQIVSEMLVKKWSMVEGVLIRIVGLE